MSEQHLKFGSVFSEEKKAGADFLSRACHRYFSLRCSTVVDQFEAQRFCPVGFRRT